MRLSKALTRLWSFLNTAAGYLSGIATLLLMLVIVYDVVLRYFFNAPTAWATDLSEILLVYITFLSAAWILSFDGHIRVDIILRTLNLRKYLLTKLMTSLVGLIYCVFLVWLSWEQAWEALQRGLRFSGYPFPQFPVLVVVPIGALLLCVQWIVHIAECLTALRYGKLTEKSRDIEKSGAV